jgi:Ion transport protein
MSGRAAASEQTPLLGNVKTATTAAAAATEEEDEEISNNNSNIKTWRHHLFDFLEAKTPAGRFYESFIMLLIALNVLAFILGSLFVTKYNPEPWAARSGDESICGNVCDSLWFGNYSDNYLQVLNLGTTSVLELVTIAVFTVEYLLRLYTADLINGTLYGGGIMGRLRWIPTFFSMVDLASTLPFYLDAFYLRDSDLLATSFVRMFRLFRMMRVEGRYDSAICLVDDVYLAQRGILGTALFVGFTTWMTVSSLYYLVERKNHDFIYCGAAPDYCKEDGDIDTSLCTIDHWGMTDCAAAGCPSSEEYPEPCYNLYNSIPMASYYALLNLFGEFVSTISVDCFGLARLLHWLPALYITLLTARPSSSLTHALYLSSLTLMPIHQPEKWWDP